MEHLPAILLSLFATLGLLAVIWLVYLRLFRQELRRSVLLVPFDGDSMLVAETLRTFRDFGFRVVAVDRSGAIDRSCYVAAGLCDGFLLPEELDAQLISPVRPPADT